jgi:hypothetical protein
VIEIDSFIPPEIREFVRTRNWPKDIDYKLSRQPDGVALVFFRDNWITLTGEEQLQATNVVKDIMFHLRPQGVPIYVAKMESRRG